MAWWLRALLFVVAVCLRILCWTLRLKVVDRAGLINIRDRDPIIFSFWHNRLLLLPYYYERFCPGFHPLALISPSRDGRMISAVARHFNVETASGSTSKQGAKAALKAVHASKNQMRVDLCITPDGPRGPKYVLQPGVLHLSQLTGRQIVPITYHLSHKWVFKSWDGFQIPYPFSHCTLILEPKVAVPETASEAELEELGKILAQRMGT